MSGRSTFNENNWEQFLYRELANAEAEKYLKDESIGTFLLRGCSTEPRAYVICIKEHEGVNQYKINVNEDRTEFYLREESKFQNMLSLLAFYKRNLFLSSQLGLPIDPSKLPNASPSSRLAPAPQTREASPGNVSQSEFLAKVIKRKQINVHETEYLDLRIGDIIKVRRMSPNGDMEVEYDGQVGKYPFIMVELLHNSAVPGNRSTL